MSILHEIAEKTRIRIAKEKEKDPGLPQRVEESLRREPAGDGRRRFMTALGGGSLGFICEVKKASPSKGVIARDFPYVEIAREYEAAGAEAVSVLTEPFYFGGSDRIFREIREAVDLPILRKDFTVDPYMIYQAKEMGADAVLLICSILSEEELRSMRELAERLGLAAVVEAHDADEIRMAVRCGAKIVGVNNRNLGDFTVDTGRAGLLRKCVPEDCLFISESGMRSRTDAATAEKMGADAVLVGETMMRAKDKTAMLLTLRGLRDEKEASGTRVKICGLKSAEEITWVNELHPDYVGFVFAHTKRYIDFESASLLKARLASDIQAVGVFVDEDPEVVKDLLRRGTIDIAQLHGNESDETIRDIREATGQPVWKAVVLGGKERQTTGMEPWEAYPSADLLLLDAGRGSGGTFDWELARAVTRPYMLAGGLTDANVTSAVSSLHPFGVDVSSGVENPGGGKNYEKMRAFIENARCAMER